MAANGLRLGLLLLGVGRELWKDRIGLGYSEGFSFGLYREAERSLAPLGAEKLSSDTGNYLSGVGISNFYNDPSRITIPDGRNPSFALQHTFRVSVKFLERLSMTEAVSFDDDFVIYRYGQDRARAFEVLR